MTKKYALILAILLITGLSGCLGSLWTGASLMYDRYNVYKKLNDFQLLLSVKNALFHDKQFKRPDCIIDIAVFNGDILIIGHLPTDTLLEKVNQRLSTLHGYRRLFNSLTIKQTPSNTIQDAWITSKIRSKIFADSSIDPNAFKIVTCDRIVYLMGDVDSEQAAKVINLARYTQGVERVIKVLKYFTYQTK